METGGGLHIHHLVWGIVLLMVSGFLGFALQPESPWMDVLAVLFGVGMGLTLDEFALWLHLQDVYWSDEGRQSVDAVVIALAFGGLVVLGLSPLDVADRGESTAVIAGLMAVHVAYCVVCILKGKIWLGLIGLFVPLLGLAGMVRVAKPRSPWARRFYAPGSRRLERARARYARLERRRHRLMDAVAGAPSEPDPKA